MTAALRPGGFDVSYATALAEQEMVLPKYQLMLTLAISEFHGIFSRFSGGYYPEGACASTTLASEQDSTDSVSE